MLKQINLLLAALLVLNFVLGQSVSMRMLSYNIRNAKGLDNVTDYKRIANVLEKVNANVFALQELDSVTKRSNGKDVLLELAKETGMYASYAAAIDFSGGKYGVGILSKEKPVAQRSIPLPGSEEKRVLLIVEFKNYVLFCTHLSLTEADRLSSAELINQEAATYRKPIFLAGDLNDTPTSAMMQLLTKQWNTLSAPAPSFPANNPDRCIDYIMSYKNSKVMVKKSMVIDEPLASDHRPVLVEISW